MLLDWVSAWSVVSKACAPHGPFDGATSSTSSRGIGLPTCIDGWLSLRQPQQAIQLMPDVNYQARRQAGGAIKAQKASTLSSDLHARDTCRDPDAAKRTVATSKFLCSPFMDTFQEIDALMFRLERRSMCDENIVARCQLTA